VSDGTIAALSAAAYVNVKRAAKRGMLQV